MSKTIQTIFEVEAKAIGNIPINQSYEKALDLIYKQVHKNCGKIITSGMGKAGQIAINIATTFSSTGTPSIFLHPSDAQHGDLGIIQEHDVLFLISNSGKTREITELVQLAKNLYPKLPTIVLTSIAGSPLAASADVVIETGNPEEVCPLGLAPTTSTTVMTVIGDALVVCMMKRIQFSAKDYALRHHGGYLGDKSRHLKERS